MPKGWKHTTHNNAGIRDVLLLGFTPSFPRDGRWAYVLCSGPRSSFVDCGPLCFSARYHFKHGCLVISLTTRLKKGQQIWVVFWGRVRRHTLSDFRPKQPWCGILKTFQKIIPGMYKHNGEHLCSFYQTWEAESKRSRSDLQVAPSLNHRTDRSHERTTFLNCVAANNRDISSQNTGWTAPRWTHTPHSHTHTRNGGPCSWKKPRKGRENSRKAVSHLEP